MMSYANFLAARRSVYDRDWSLHPSQLLSWGLRKLGLYEKSSDASTLLENRFVILKNLEVRKEVVADGNVLTSSPGPRRQDYGTAGQSQSH